MTAWITEFLLKKTTNDKKDNELSSFKSNQRENDSALEGVA